MPLKKLLILSSALTFAWSPISFAQGSIWDSPKDKKQKATQKISDGKSSYRKWRDHLEQWGREEKYTHHFAVGGKLNSDGWSGCLYLLKRISATQNHLFHFSFSEIKHEKQIKQQRNNTAYPELGQSSAFVYGKINNLYTLQLGYGREQMLLPGIIEGNLSLSFRYSGGFSLALLKPYYLKLVYTDFANNEPPLLKEEKYTNENKDQFMNANAILGSSGFSKGLGEIRPLPGVFGETSFALEVGNSKFLIQTITIGANGAYYPDKLPIMAELKPSNYTGSVFVGLALGKAWKKRH